MRFVIIGAGAVGGSLGARLAEAGREVVVVARGVHGAAIRARGLRLEAPDGALEIPLEVASAIGEVRWRDGDVALLATKTQDAEGALRELAAVAQVPVACLTNGLEAERLALRRFADVHAVSVYTPATYLEPGVVQQWSAPLRGILDVGRFPHGTTALDGALAEAFRAAQFGAEARADIMAAKRTKLLSNLSNGIEAMLGAGTRTGELAEAAQAEARAVFAAAGLTLGPPIDADPRRPQMARGEIRGARRAGGSTWQSLVRGARELETDYLNGEIALLGRLHGVPTPVNDRLQALAAKTAREGRAAGSLSVDDLS